VDRYTALVTELSSGQCASHLPLRAMVDDDELVLVSGFVEGEPLRNLLRSAGITRSPLSAPVALRIARDVIDALVAISEATGGDPPRGAPNPEQVIVGADGIARFLEGGVAGVAASMNPWKQQPKRACYDAPECFGDADVDERADVFAVGVMLWEILRNRPLFSGSSYDVVSERVRTTPIKRADSLKPAGGEAISKAVADIVAKALERDRDGRYASLSELAAALDGEPVASHADVAEAVAKLSAAGLKTLRRKVDDARSAAAATPTPTPIKADAAKQPPPPPAAPPKPPRRKATGERSPGQKAALPPRKAPKPPVDPDRSSDALAALDEMQASDEGRPSLAGDDDAADADASTLPPADDDVSTLPPADDAASTLPPADEDADEGEGDLFETQESARDGAGGAPSNDAPVNVAMPPESGDDDSPELSDFGLLSIADDPSHDTELPASAKEALARQAAKDDPDDGEKKLPVGALVVAALVAIVVVGVVLSTGGGDSDAGPQDAQPSATSAASTIGAPAPSGAASSATSAPAQPEASAAPSASASTAAEGEGGAPASEASASASASASAAPSPPPPTNRPPSTWRPKRPPPSSGTPKFTPGGI